MVNSMEGGSIGKCMAMEIRMIAILILTTLMIGEIGCMEEDTVATEEEATITIPTWMTIIGHLVDVMVAPIGIIDKAIKKVTENPDSAYAVRNAKQGLGAAEKKHVFNEENEPTSTEATTMTPPIPLLRPRETHSPIGHHGRKQMMRDPLLDDILFR